MGNTKRISELAKHLGKDRLNPAFMHVWATDSLVYATDQYSVLGFTPHTFGVLTSGAYKATSVGLEQADTEFMTRPQVENIFKDVSEWHEVELKQFVQLAKVGKAFFEDIWPKLSTALKWIDKGENNSHSPQPEPQPQPPTIMETPQKQNAWSAGTRAKIDVPLHIRPATEECVAKEPEKEVTHNPFELGDFTRYARNTKHIANDVQFFHKGSLVWAIGNTYPYKDTLKKLGFRWSKKQKSWWNKASELVTYYQ
jgi:hypothetical protein